MSFDLESLRYDAPGLEVRFENRLVGWWEGATSMRHPSMTIVVESEPLSSSSYEKSVYEEIYEAPAKVTIIPCRDRHLTIPDHEIKIGGRRLAPFVGTVPGYAGRDQDIATNLSSWRWKCLEVTLAQYEAIFDLPRFIPADDKTVDMDTAAYEQEKHPVGEYAGFKFYEGVKVMKPTLAARIFAT